MITLYHCDGARSFRPLWMLEEQGLAYELKMLPFPPRVFAKEYMAINPLGKDHSIVTQAIGVLATIAWSGAATFGILMICKFTTGLRVSTEGEVEGLDRALHGETLHEGAV